MKPRNSFKPCVYLVEDDQDDQYMFKMLLDDLGHDIDLHIFENGQVAFNALNEADIAEVKVLPDLILLDLNLPVWDGKKTLEEIKQHQLLKMIPILVYTTSKSEYDMKDCYQLGANSFISKATEYESLKAQIDSILGYWFKVCS